MQKPYIGAMLAVAAFLSALLLPFGRGFAMALAGVGSALFGSATLSISPDPEQALMVLPLCVLLAMAAAFAGAWVGRRFLAYPRRV